MFRLRIDAVFESQLDISARYCESACGKWLEFRGNDAVSLATDKDNLLVQISVVYSGKRLYAVSKSPTSLLFRRKPNCSGEVGSRCDELVFDISSRSEEGVLTDSTDKTLWFICENFDT